MNKNDFSIQINFFIPAFNKNQQGLVIDLQLQAIPNPQFSIITSGSIAQSLERSFSRVVEIISSLNPFWNCLTYYQYSLLSFNEQFKVKDARSADLSLCIAALNVIRNHKRLESVNKYAGTGILRIDGSFGQTSLEEIKQKATVFNQKTFLNSKHCDHIFDLNELLNKV